MRQAVVVLGMHRSGTSFLARSLASLGYALPRDAQPGAEDNRHGHCEPRAVVDLNDRILAAAGGRWDQAAPFTADAAAEVCPDLSREMREALAESFGAARRIVLKDPRLCLTFGLWRPELAAMGIDLRVLVALRHPVAAAQSLARRNALPPDLAGLSWMAHAQGALESSEGLPRAILTFPDWVAEPGASADTIAAALDLPRPMAELWADGAQRQFCADDLHCLPTGSAQGRLIAATNMFDALSGGDDPVETLARFRPMIARAQRALAPLDRYRLGEIARYSGKVPARDSLRADRLEALLAHSEARATVLTAQRDRAEETARAAADRGAHARALLSRRLAIARRAATLGGQRRGAEALALLGQLRAARRALALRQGEAGAAGARAQDLDHRLTCALAECARLRTERDANDRRATDLAQLVQKEKQTVLRPIYRRLYRGGGSLLRNLLPAAQVDRIKRLLPHPEGIPVALSMVPPPSVARDVGIPPRPAAGDKADIFILSIINWDFRTQRPQHLAREFAARGHRVFYLEMEGAEADTTLRPVADGVWVVRLADHGVGFVRPYSGCPSGRQVEGWLAQFNALCDRIGASPWRHIVVEHPYWWAFARHLSPENRITFDCMDEIAGFSNTEAHVLAAEEEMVAACDRLVVSSDYLMAKRGAGRAAALVRNGADIAHFTGATDAPLPSRIADALRPGRLRVGYVGAIAEWFDEALLAEVAGLAPDVDFHLCGAVTAPGPLRLADLPNVSLHGEIAYAEVPAFLQAMDVMIIPFRLLPIIAACDPVKFYEYSAAMRPTVATPMPELRRAGDLVRTADNAADFVAAIRTAAASTDPLGGERLRNYALANTWSGRATAMLAEMERAPLVSIVILAWGDAALTMTAVHALLGESRIYPALEVIVVDNGSPAEECARLADYLARFPEARLIENGANLGFAAGNNVGIAAATGDHVLLLNNDTFMAPGAIWAMVTHLERNPQIGVVGPLTNNIGNEARVAVDYADMSAMRTAARGLTQGFRGRWTPLPVLAYFCAMFRRGDLERFGPLDPAYGRGMFEDDDHCAVIRAQGFECALAEDAFVHHHLSASFAQVEPAERRARFEANRRTYEERWGPWAPHRYRDTRPAPAWEAA
ncbi:glycosyltransferase [Albidovulum sediminicola]|uniref:Glycosyltransferase n=1 Tax=Albidovulum sediminicola TaxID=2984331 RepID=A0ABT2Z3C9_9RHOB|nr:glycosyltransferase [Defluviimonas sp. WL0075]MCV2865291.1 glycosyltransferase [Defluviimonas sp. WL0075]